MGTVISAAVPSSAVPPSRRGGAPPVAVEHLSLLLSEYSQRP